MQELEGGPCPLHGTKVAVGCDWCSLGDRLLVLEQIRAQLRPYLFVEDPRAILLSMLLLGHVGDALAVDATVSVAGRSVQVHRYLIRPDSVLPLG
jgi:hypothetical protein